MTGVSYIRIHWLERTAECVVCRDLAVLEKNRCLPVCSRCVDRLTDEQFDEIVAAKLNGETDEG